MKTILYTIFAVVLFASCKKDKNCYQCTTTNTYTMETWTDPTKYCDWDATDAIAHSEKHNSMNTFYVGTTKHMRRMSCNIVH